METDAALSAPENLDDAAKALTLVDLAAQMSGQNALLRMQAMQLQEEVRQLRGAFETQSQQFRASDQALHQELRKFQTGGPQRAMAAVYHKLLRELVKHVTDLDGLVALADEQLHGADEKSWIEALRVARDRFESILKDWGCQPLTVEVGVQEFDAELHEAAHADPDEIAADAPVNVILKVHRRGWKLHDQILQYAQVLVR